MTLGECEWVPPSLIRRSKGRVVIVSSLLARIPSPVRGIYCAVKVDHFKSINNLYLNITSTKYTCNIHYICVCICVCVY